MSAPERWSEKWIFGREANLRGQIWNFEDNLSAKDTISQQQARKGFIYFITLPLIFISNLNRTQKASVDLKTNGRNCWERVNLIGFSNFISTLIRPKLDRLWCEMNFAVPQNTWRSVALAFWFVFCYLLCNFWNNISDQLSNVITP